MSKELKPGMKCLIAPWSGHQYSGRECATIRFFGLGQDAFSGYVAEDWWIIDIPGVPCSFKEFRLGACARWLIPLWDKDEDQKQTKTKAKPRERIEETP